MPETFQEHVFTELRAVETRLTSVENRLTAFEDWIKVDWASFRRDFSQHNAEMKELLGDLDRKFDVINHELLGLKAEQIRIDRTH